MSSNNTICSWPRVRIPDACRDVEIVIGVDEAGRGPVLGSLIYCAAFWPASLHDEISNMGFNDSKQLSESNRDVLFNKMLKHPSIGWVIEELTAPYLSREMLRPTPISLNSLSYDAVVRALQIIKDGDSIYSYQADVPPGSKVNTLPPIINQIYIDTVGDPDYYKSKLIQGLGQDYGTFTIEKKADATYKVVSAASIIAKVTRDTLMKEWTCDLRLPVNSRKITNHYGSGYPGDPACVQWLQESYDAEKVFLYPNDITRFSWGTIKEIVKASNCVDVKWACDDEDIENGGKATNSVNLTSYFGNKAGEKRPSRCNYFIKKKLKHVLPSEWQ